MGQMRFQTILCLVLKRGFEMFSQYLREDKASVTHKNRFVNYIPVPRYWNVVTYITKLISGIALNNWNCFNLDKIFTILLEVQSYALNLILCVLTCTVLDTYIDNLFVNVDIEKLFLSSFNKTLSIKTSNRIITTLMLSP